MSVRSFMLEYVNSTKKPGWHSDSRVWQEKVAFCLEAHWKWVGFRKIRSLNPGRGEGSQGLDWLCALADRHQVRLQGIIEPFGFGPRLNEAQLEAWYLRHGFEVTNGYYIERKPLMVQ